MHQGEKGPVMDTEETDSTAPRRLLVVDDSDLQRHLLVKTLANWKFDVAGAASAEEAIALCDRRLPDIVISDWMMPGLSGLQFCEVFREMSRDAYGYFILLTSKSEKAEVAQGLLAGADDFLTKPVDPNELRARITVGERIVTMQRELARKNRLLNVTLEELQRVYDVVDRDLVEARKLQHSLVRDRHHVLPEGTISLLLRSAGHVGGDLVGHFPSDDGKLGFFAMDVSGHGISSALLAARLAGYLSASAPDQNIALSRQADGRYVARPPAEVVTLLNSVVLNEIGTDQYFTLLLGFVDLASGDVSFVQAGHPHPLVQRADGTVEAVGRGGFPVGLMPDARFDCCTLDLAAGDRIILLSDGVSECPGPDGVALGDGGVETLLRRHRDRRGPDLFKALIVELLEHAGTDDFPDDISGVVFEYRGPPSGGELSEEHPVAIVPK